MRSYWPLHATRQVHDDDQLAGYTWILLAGVRDRNVVTVASAALLVPSLDGRVSPSGVPTPGGCRLVQPANRSVLLGRDPRRRRRRSFTLDRFKHLYPEADLAPRDRLDRIHEATGDAEQPTTASSAFAQHFPST
jgi:hypothetical protein